MNGMVSVTSNRCGWCRYRMMAGAQRGVWALSFQLMLNVGQLLTPIIGLEAWRWCGPGIGSGSRGEGTG